MHKKVKRICIFGAGSAGWVTVLGLKALLPGVDITIICPNKHGSIGVGESTLPDLLWLLEQAGIDLTHFMANTDSVFKHGMYFKNWNGEGTHYWHPFSSLERTGNMYSRAHHYHTMNKIDPIGFPRKDYYKRVHPSWTLAIENNLSSTDMGYALHVNAIDFANYIKDFVKDSVRVIDAETFDIKHNDSEIESITVNGSTIVEADLFIDCTGFNRALISKISELEHDNYQANVNVALFGRVQYDHPMVNFIPYTKGEATKNGWIWTTPIRSQVGTGYCYHSDFTTEEEARADFLKYWNGALKEENIRKIPFSSTSLKQPWTGNVVAIGLSSGWVEPLEATGLSTFIQAISSLTRFLTNNYYDEDVINRYNANTVNHIEDIKDFIDVHYVLSARRDSKFWEWATSREIHPRLQAKLEVYRKFMPNLNNRNQTYSWAFNDVSWIDTLTGYNFEFDPVTNTPPWLLNKRDMEIYTDFNKLIKGR